MNRDRRRGTRGWHSIRRERGSGGHCKSDHALYSGLASNKDTGDFYGDCARRLLFNTSLTNSFCRLDI